tara:strand:- start:1552 stop:2025 length:474 start_codon:yes stop_codon:yes gene_type:complete
MRVTKWAIDTFKKSNKLKTQCADVEKQLDELDQDRKEVAEAHPRNAYSVLYIDDNSDMHQMARREIEDCEVDLICVSDGIAASLLHQSGSKFSLCIVESSHEDMEDVKEFHRKWKLKDFCERICIFTSSIISNSEFPVFRRSEIDFVGVVDAMIKLR